MPTDLLSVPVTAGTPVREAQADNIAPFIDRSFEQALEWAYLREGLSNGIEAGASLFITEPDWVYLDQCDREGRAPVYRLTLWDNGRGMNKDELYRFHKLFWSGKTVAGHHANFGMGAKISSVPCNPYGFVVMSWQDGIGHMIRYVRTPNGRYGLQRLPVQDDDGTTLYQEVVPTPDEYDWEYERDERGSFLRDKDGNFIRHPREHGTLIIFMGDHEDCDTYLVPPGRDEKKWAWHHRINSYILNRRYAKMPLTVFAYEVASKYKYRKGDKKLLWARNRDEATATYDKKTGMTRGKGHDERGYGRRGGFRKIVGCETLFHRECSHNGTIDTPECQYRWYLFDRVAPEEHIKAKADVDAPRRRDATEHAEEDGLYDSHNADRYGWDPYAPTPGMIALIYKGEVYNISEDTDVTRYAQFGLYRRAERERVVIFVEPRIGETSGVYPNDVRSELKHFNEPGGKLPWSRWGEEFRRRTKSEALPLHEFIQREGPATGVSADVHARIDKELDKLRDALGLRTNRKPPSPKDPIDDLLHSDENVDDEPSDENKPENKEKPPRKPSTSRRGRGMPGYLIVTPQEMPDPPRAAEYLAATNMVKVYLGFNAIRETARRWIERYPDNPYVETVIENAVAEAYTVIVVAKVAHARMLEGTKWFDRGDFENMVSAEALTTCVLGYRDADALILPLVTGFLKIKATSDGAAAK